MSNITDVGTDEIEIWRNRPVDEVYPIVYIDGELHGGLQFGALGGSGG
jgi:transposase-like protein